MSHWKDMPVAGTVVIVVIAVLFVVALVMLFHLAARYRRYSRLIVEEREDDSDFLRYTLDEFTAAYRDYGKEINTPGIMTEAMGTKLSGLLLQERFLNNAVSLFVTLGLFGTFLGLSMAVTSLTQLISFSNTSEWLSVLDSVGGGLMSALSGMGVAFYTSLVGAGCSIVLTILRTVFNPQSQREKLAAQMELWLDHTIAPTLPTRTAKDEAELVQRMIDAMNKTADSLEKTLAEDFPVHVVEKKIAFMGPAGETVSPAEPNGYKFELLMIDQIRSLPSCLPYEVEREREFAPIKNKTGRDSVESARQLCLRNGIQL